MHGVFGHILIALNSLTLSHGTKMVLYLGEVTDENNVLLVLLTHVFVWHFHSHFDDLISPFNSAVQLLGVPE